MNGIFSNLIRLFRDKGGNVATIFAVALVPITIVGGSAVDVGQAMNARGRLAEALDAAALAVGAQEGLSQEEAQTLAMD